MASLVASVTILFKPNEALALGEGAPCQALPGAVGPAPYHGASRGDLEAGLSIRWLLPSPTHPIPAIRGLPVPWSADQ